MTGKLRRFAWFAAALAMAPAMAVAQIELMVWHAYRGAEKAAFEKVVANFNKAKAGEIKVTTLAVP